MPGGNTVVGNAKSLSSPLTLTLARVPQILETSNGMRTMTQLSLEGMRSRVALKDFATDLGFAFMGGIWRDENFRKQEGTRKSVHFGKLHTHKNSACAPT